MRGALPFFENGDHAQGPGRGDHLRRRAEPRGPLHQPDGRAGRRPRRAWPPRGDTALYDSLDLRPLLLRRPEGEAGDHPALRRPGLRQQVRASTRPWTTPGAAAWPSTPSGSTSSEFEVRTKLQRLAEETGGRAFFIGASRELSKVFETVEKELRSQYLLAYQSSNPGRDDKFRAVEVKVAKPGLEAKTVRGYYP